MPGEKRNFVISSCNGKKVADVGNFVSTTPKAAAQKAARSLFKGRAESASTMTFCIRETTNGSKKKVYSYTAVKKVLDPPIIVNRGGKEIQIKVEYTLKPAPLPAVEKSEEDTVKPVRKPRAKKAVVDEEKKPVRKPRAKKASPTKSPVQDVEDAPSPSPVPVPPTPPPRKTRARKLTVA